MVCDTNLYTAACGEDVADDTGQRRVPQLVGNYFKIRFFTARSLNATTGCFIMNVNFKIARTYIKNRSSTCKLSELVENCLDIFIS